MNNENKFKIQFTAFRKNKNPLDFFKKLLKLACTDEFYDGDDQVRNIKDLDENWESDFTIKTDELEIIGGVEFATKRDPFHIIIHSQEKDIPNKVEEILEMVEALGGESMDSGVIGISKEGKKFISNNGRKYPSKTNWHLLNKVKKNDLDEIDNFGLNFRWFVNILEPYKNSKREKLGITDDMIFEAKDLFYKLKKLPTGHIVLWLSKDWYFDKINHDFLDKYDKLYSFFTKKREMIENGENDENKKSKENTKNTNSEIKFN